MSMGVPMTTKTEKGSGGKRGHSGQDNWVTHQEEKQMGRKQRRRDDKELARAAKVQQGGDD